MSKGTQPRSNSKAPIMRTRKQASVSKEVVTSSGSAAVTAAGGNVSTKVKPRCWTFTLNNNTTAAALRVAERASVSGSISGTDVIVSINDGTVLGYVPRDKAKIIIQASEKFSGKLGGSVVSLKRGNVEVRLCLS